MRLPGPFGPPPIGLSVETAVTYSPPSSASFRMDFIAKHLRDPEWLFSVLIVAGILSFAMSVLAAFATRRLDKFWGRFSEKRRTANADKAERISTAAKALLDDPVRLQIHIANKTTYEM